MIKRPIVWFGLAYVFGEILGNIIGWAALPAFAVLFAACITICVHSGRIQRKAGSKILLSRTGLILCALPFFVFSGSCRYLHAAGKAADVWSAGDFKRPVRFIGIVEKTEMKANSKYIEVSVIREAGSSGKDMGNPSIPERLLLVADRKETADHGDVLMASGTPVRFEKASNPGTYNAWEANIVSGLYYQMFPESMQVIGRSGRSAAKAVLKLKAGLMDVYERALDEKTAGILCGIILGDKQKLDMDLKNLYQSQGIGHLFAVSGLHMSMAGVGIYRLLRKLTVPSGFALGGAALLMLGYSFMCGMPSSCIRAIIMAALLMGAEFFGRSYDGLSALALAALVILWQQPLGLTSFSIIMSFCAVFCLIGFLPAAAAAKNGRLAEKIMPGLSITLLTTPILAWYLYEIPLYSTVLNLLLLPLMSILFPVGAIGGAVGLVCLPAAEFLLGIVYYILQLYTLVCMFFEKFPFSIIVTGRPSPVMMVLLCMIFPIVFVTAARRRQNGLLLAGIVFFAAEYGLLAMPKIPGTARVVFMDVGQGDCALLSMKDGTNWLIDGGSSSEKDVHVYTIEKVLKYYGIGRLDGIFLSHMDSDHTNGAVGLMMSGYPVDRLYLPACCPSKDKLAAICETAAQWEIPAEIFAAGRSIGQNAAGWQLTCLHPSPDFSSDDDNEASMMLLLNIEEFRVLFTGDGESAAETAAGEKLSDIDLMKAGHHGSKNSSGSQFLMKTAPEAVVISCGKNNRYGHPHKEALDRFKHFGCKIFVTSQNGAVIVKTEHGRFVLRSCLTGKN